MPMWIDFKELRSKLKFEDVLRHYGVEIKRRGDQHMGSCPLRSHEGKGSSPSFSVNLERGIFHCFGCGAKGNVLDFAVLMSGEATDDGRAVKKVAAELRAKFCGETAKAEPARKPTENNTRPESDQLELSVSINVPLDFELQGLDQSHPYLAGRGFVKETISRFGLGFCARGSLKGRIAIPLHDSDGTLIGYAGRVVDDATVTTDNPRYRMPTKREREGKVFEFRKALFLYNGFRFKERYEDLIVVAGFPSVWWLTQNGFGRVVATMGGECSDEQAKLIVSKVAPGGRVWVMPDGGRVGDNFAQSVLSGVAPHRFVRWVKLEDGCQPTDLSAHQLKGFLTG